MGALAVEPHTQYRIDVSRARLPETEIENVQTLLRLDVREGRLLRRAFPDRADLDFVGVYELSFPFRGREAFHYYLISGFPPIELIHFRFDRSVLDDPDGAKWLNRAAAKCRDLHEVLATSNQGV
jgi:hypothetical protein